MELEGLELWLIIIFLIAIVISNISIFSRSSKFKLPQFGHPSNPRKNDHTAKDEKLQSDIAEPIAPDNNIDKTNKK